MDIAAAKTAGVLATSIDQLDAKIALARRMLADKCRVASLTGVSPDGVEQIVVSVGDVDAETSVAAWQYVLGIYQAKRDTLAPQLAAL